MANGIGAMFGPQGQQAMMQGQQGPMFQQPMGNPLAMGNPMMLGQMGMNLMGNKNEEARLKQQQLAQQMLQRTMQTAMANRGYQAGPY